MSDSQNKRSTDNVIVQMAGDVGYIRSKVETLITDTKQNTDDIEDLKSAKKTARGMLIGATVLAGTTGSAIHTGIMKLLEHLP